MSRKSKGECTCKIVAQNERGMLGQVRDSVYRGVKYYGEDGQVEKRFCFPRKLAEEKWLEWLDADLTEDELRILEPLNRKQRRVAKRANEHNAKLKAELEEERNVEGRPKNMDAQAVEVLCDHGNRTGRRKTRNGAYRRARCLRYVRSVGGSRCCAHREGELRGCRDDTSPLKDRQGGSEPLRRKPEAG